MTRTDFIPPGIRDEILATLPNHCAKVCEQILVETGDLLFSMVILVTESEVKTLTIPVPTHATEAAVIAGLRRHLKEHGAIGYAVCTEGWIRLTGTAGLSDKVPPSEHPDGVEAVLIMGDRPGGRFNCFFKILRDGDGKITGLGDDLVAGRKPPTTGLFMGLLDPEPMLH